MWDINIFYTMSFKKYQSLTNVIYVCIYVWLRLHLLPHIVTLCFTYADDDDELQTGAELSVTLTVIALRLRY